MRLLEANDPQDHPDDGDEEAEPERFDDQLHEPLGVNQFPRRWPASGTVRVSEQRADPYVSRACCGDLI